MEADWEIEIGADAPVIDACWPGFIDLRWGDAPDSVSKERARQERVQQISETAAFPALAGALLRLNGPSSPVWTSKCDFWPSLQTEEFDADELDASPRETAHAMGCYIDLLPLDENSWLNPSVAAEFCKSLCARLVDLPLRCSRVDLIVRAAVVIPKLAGTGITAYVTACGADDAKAAQTLETALSTFAGALCSAPTLQ